MTFVRFTPFFLFLLILRHISSEEPEPQFRAKDSNVDVGYCFEGDIVVYKSTLEGDQLLGNSSDRNKTGAAPAGLEGRTRIISYSDLLMLQIVNVTNADSGIYRLECWQNQTRVINETLRLSVCNQEVASEQIIAKEDGGAELLCNSSFIGLEGISVHWYYEMEREFKLTLLLDSSVSLKPLVEGLHGVVEVKERGALLVIDDNVLKNHQQFACVVINGTDCLSFQNMYTLDNMDSSEMFASQGDEVVLFCPADGHNQYWITPLGKLNGSSSVNTPQMYVSSESGNFSLIIPAVSDQHSGRYSCLSSTIYSQYGLFVCPEEEYQEKLAHESGTITVECRMDHSSSLNIKWYRIELSGQDELLYDSRDETVAAPVDLRDRLTPSEDGSLLTISDLKVTDGEAFWCVALSTHEHLERDEDYFSDFEGEDIEETDDDDNEYDYLPSIRRCLSKQVTWLTVTRSSAATSEGSANVVGYAVGGGLVGLLVIVATVVGVVLVKRAKASAKQRQAAPQSGRHLKEDGQLKRDPGCTERLTPHDDVA